MKRISLLLCLVLLFALRTASAFDSLMIDGTTEWLKGYTNFYTGGFSVWSNQFGKVTIANGSLSSSNLSSTNISGIVVKGTNMTALNLASTTANLGNGQIQLNGTTGQITGLVLGGPIGAISNGWILNTALTNPISANLINYGNALSSPGSGLLSEQFGFGSVASGQQAYAAGVLATASGLQSMALGYFPSALGDYSFAAGFTAQATMPFSLANGYDAQATAPGATAIGAQTRATHTNSAVFGYGAQSSRNNQTTLGSAGVETLIGGSLTVVAQISNANFAGPVNFPIGSDIALKFKSYTTLGNGVNVDLPVGTNTFVEISGNTADASISGLDAANAQRDGAIRFLLYRQPYTLTFHHSSVVDPVAANRIISLTSLDRVSAGPCAAGFVYNSSASRWVLFAFESLSATSVTNVSLYSILTNGASVNNYVRFDGTNLVFSNLRGDAQSLTNVPPDWVIATSSIKVITNIVAVTGQNTFTISGEGDGSAYTNLNAAALASGIVPEARLSASTANNGNVLSHNSTSGTANWTNAVYLAAVIAQALTNSGTTIYIGSGTSPQGIMLTTTGLVFVNAVGAATNVSAKLGYFSGNILTPSQVGVGTTSPDANHKVHLVRSSAAANPYGLLVENFSTGASGVMLRNSSLPSNNNFQFFVNSGGTAFIVGQDNVGDYLTIDSSLSASAGTAHFVDDVFVGGDMTITGDVNVTGKVTGTGGIDPPYLLLDLNTRAKLKGRVMKEVPKSKQDSPAFFFNEETRKVEYYIASTDKFYDFTGKELLNAGNVVGIDPPARVPAQRTLNGTNLPPSVIKKSAANKAPGKMKAN